MESVTINEIFRPLLTNDDRYYFLTGGRGSGKSFSVAWSMLMLSFEEDHVMLYTRLTMVSANKSIIPEFKKMIELMGLEEHFIINADQVVNKTSGSVIWFMGLKSSSGANTARLKSLSGVTTWIIDEFEDMQEEEELFDKIDNSIRTKNKLNRVIMIMNPTTHEFWAYERWFMNPGMHPVLYGSARSKDGCTYIHTTWLDCADHLDDSWINKALSLQKLDPVKYEKTYLGGWRDKAEGVILSNWDYGEFPEDVHASYGADWGYRDPFALVKTHISKKEAKIYVKLLEYSTELIETEIFAKIFKHIGRSTIIADSAQPATLEAFRRKGIDIVGATKGPDSIMKGLAILQDYKLIIDPDNSKMLVKELNNYVYDDKEKKERPKPNSGYDHAIDALRYNVFYEVGEKFSNMDHNDFYF